MRYSHLYDNKYLLNTFSRRSRGVAMGSFVPKCHFFLNKYPYEGKLLHYLNYISINYLLSVNFKISNGANLIFTAAFKNKM